MVLKLGLNFENVNSQTFDLSHFAVKLAQAPEGQSSPEPCFHMSGNLLQELCDAAAGLPLDAPRADDETDPADDQAPAAGADAGDARARDAMLSRPLFVARELTKVHEQHWRGTVGAALAALDAGDGSLPARGEFTLVLGPRGVGVAAATGASEARIGDAIVDERIEALRKAGEPTKRLARTVATEFGLRRSDVYARAVALSNST